MLENPEALRKMVKETGAVNYKSYGVLATINKNLLRRLMEQMVLEGYLTVGDYQVIKLGDISELKKDATTVLVKITDEDKKPEQIGKTKKKTKGMETLTSVGFKLFDKLKAVRLEIAREENMPPYIIFSDKTLIDMAAKVPTTQSEMLNVTGVGENKYAKYGKQFIDAIEECIAAYPELILNEVGTVQNEIKAEDEKDSSWLAEKRKQHAGAYMPWTKEEDRKLVNEFKSERFSIRDLSLIHERTPGAIRARLKKLGLID